MEKRPVSALLAILFAAFFSAAAWSDPPPRADGSFVLAVGDEQWAGIQTWTGPDSFSGLYASFLEALCGKMGWTPAFEPLPWARAQKSVELGGADAFIAIATPGRLEYAAASDSAVFTLFFTIYYAKDHPREAEIKSLKTLEDVLASGFSTVSNRGNGWHIENVEKLGIPTSWVSDDTTMLRFLAAGRADLIIDTPVSMHSKLAALGMENRILSTGVHIGETRLVLLLGKKSPHYPDWPRINSAVTEIVRSPSWRSLLKDLTGLDE